VIRGRILLRPLFQMAILFLVFVMLLTILFFTNKNKKTKNKRYTRRRPKDGYRPEITVTGSIRDFKLRGWKARNYGNRIVLNGFYHSKLGKIPGKIIIEPSTIPDANHVSYYVIRPPRALVDSHPHGICLRPVNEDTYIVHWGQTPESIMAGIYSIEQRLNELRKD